MHLTHIFGGQPFMVDRSVERRKWMKGLRILSRHCIFNCGVFRLWTEWRKIGQAQKLPFSDLHNKLMKTQHIHQENKTQGQCRLSNGFFPARLIKCITEKEDWTSMTEHEIMYEQPRDVWHRWDLLHEHKVQTALSSTKVRARPQSASQKLHVGQCGRMIHVLSTMNYLYITLWVEAI